MKIKSWTLGLIVLVFIFGGISISSAAGYWQTDSSKIPAVYNTGEFAGQYNPADIRGSYTFGDINQSFDLPLTDLAAAFGIEIDRAPDFQVKELESLYLSEASGQTIGTSSVRIFVALYKGLPIELSTSDYFLPAAISLLKEKAVLTPAQISYLDAQTYQSSSPPTTEPVETAIPASTPATATPTPSTPEATHTQTAGTITGKTTFKDLMNLGLSQSQIESIINDKMPDAGLAVRDYASQKGVEFSTLKDLLQNAINAMQK